MSISYDTLVLAVLFALLRLLLGLALIADARENISFLLASIGVTYRPFGVEVRTVVAFAGTNFRCVVEYEALAALLGFAGRLVEREPYLVYCIFFVA